MYLRIQRCWEKYCAYYQRTDDSLYYATALILHPEYRTKYVQKNWKKEWQEAILPRVRELWKQYQTTHLQDSPSISYENIHSKEQEPLDDYDLILEKLRSQIIHNHQDFDEYDHYCAEDPYEIPGQTALQWWCQDLQRKRWPQLSRFAIEVLSIPAMSDEPERVFSGGRRTISWERMSLEVSNIEKTECLKSWYRGNFWKDKS